MAKKRGKSGKQQKNNAGMMSRQNILIAGGVLVALVLVFALIMLSSGSGDDDTAPIAEASQLISPQDYQAQFAEGDSEYVLIDVRTQGEFASGHIVDSINIPVEELQSRINEVPEGMPVVVYCRTGNRSAQAASILEEAGFFGIYDLGGIVQWQEVGYSLVN